MVVRDEQRPRAENLNAFHVQGIDVDNEELKQACFKFRESIQGDIEKYSQYTKGQAVKSERYTGINKGDFLKSEGSSMLGALHIQYEQGASGRYLAFSGSLPISFFDDDTTVRLNGSSYLLINNADFHTHFTSENLFNLNGEKTNFKVNDIDANEHLYCAAKKLLSYVGWSRSCGSQHVQPKTARIKSVSMCEVWFRNPQSAEDMNYRRWSQTQSVQPCNGCKVLLPLLKLGVQEIEDIFHEQISPFPRNQHCIPFELLTNEAQHNLQLRLRQLKNKQEKALKRAEHEKKAAKRR